MSQAPMSLRVDQCGIKGGFMVQHISSFGNRRDSGEGFVALFSVGVPHIRTARVVDRRHAESMVNTVLREGAAHWDRASFYGWLREGGAFDQLDPFVPAFLKCLTNSFWTCTFPDPLDPGGGGTDPDFLPPPWWQGGGGRKKEPGWDRSQDQWDGRREQATTGGWEAPALARRRPAVGWTASGYIPQRQSLRISFPRKIQSPRNLGNIQGIFFTGAGPLYPGGGVFTVCDGAHIVTKG